MIRRFRDDRDERGAIIALVALSMVAILTVAALVVDIAVLKSDRRFDRDAADAAATSGALDLDGSTTGPASACAVAWTTALLNLRVSSSGVTSPCSTNFTTACSAASPVTATGSVSGYTITITNPVPDMIGGSINPLLKATAIGGNVSQTANATYDGAACDRLAVEITRSRNSVFAGVAGSNNQSTTVHSVARYNPASGGPKIPALVALNKTACPSIDASSGTIHVYNNGTYPGIIDADSKATAASCSSATTFNAGSNGSIIADSNTDTPPMAGILGYSAPALSSAFPSVGTYTGTPTYEVPRTRSYPDSTYHCGNVSPLR